MALINIPAGSKANSATLRHNFLYLEDLIQAQIQTLTSLVNNATASLEAMVASFESSVYKIGEPKISLTNTLNDNEIWLQGAEVSKTDYATLYSIYGDTYGTPEQAGNFVLPDFRDKALWGGIEFGYLAAALPNITGTLYSAYGGLGGTGAFVNNRTLPYNQSGIGSYPAGVAFSAANSSSVYQNGVETVQPPSIIVRVKTRFE